MGYKPMFDASNASPFNFVAVGDTLEGYYMGSFPHEGNYGPTQKHIFKDLKTGAALCVMGQTHLKQQLTSATKYACYKVTYVGLQDSSKVKKGKQPMKMFDILEDLTNKTEGSEVELTPTDNFEAVEEPNFEEAPLDGEEVVEAAPPRAQAPRQPARPPSAANQAKVQELLNRNRAKTA